MRIKFLSLSLIILLGLLISCKSDSQPEPSKSSAPPQAGVSAPNVLLITLDAVRADRLGCYGYSKARTPALDSLAAGGVRFAQAFSQSPLTLPAHASIMTGLYPAEHSLLEDGRYRLPEDITTLAEVFREKGFSTAAFIGGAFLDAYYGLGQGFQRYDDEFTNAEIIPEDRLVRPSQEVTDAALAWLKKQLTSPAQSSSASSQPQHSFFCWVNLADARIADDLSASADSSNTERYDQQLSLIDSQIGRLIDSLKNSQALDNTLLVLAAAQGEALGDHSECGRGLFLYSSTLQVPLIFYSPKRLPAGQTISAVVGLVDIFPTILDFQGWLPLGRISPAQGQDSSFKARSLLSILQGKSLASQPAYARTDYPAQKFGWSNLRSLTTESWRYIEAPQPELYDLRADPGQVNNLAAVQVQQVANLRGTLLELEKSISARPAVKPQLSQRSLQILRGLAELPLEYRSDAAPVPQKPPDPKDMISAYQNYLAGTSLLAQDKYNEALEHLTAAASQSPASPHILFALAKTYQRLGQFEQAYRNLRLALALDPFDPMLLSQMASLLMSAGKFSQTIDYCQLSLEIKSIQPQTYNDLAVAVYASKQTDASVKFLQDALQIWPNYADAHFNLAVIEAHNGHDTEAIRHFRAATQGRPDFPEAFFQWGQILLEQQRYSEAVEKFKQVLVLDPLCVDAHQQLANVLVAQNNFDEAIVHYRTALEHAAPPLQAVLRQDLGRALLRKGQLPEAVSELEQAVRMDPDLAEAHGWLAQALMANDQNDRALEHFQLALRLRPIFPEAAKALSQLALNKAHDLAKAGQFDQAIKLLDEVRALIPQDMDLTNALARYFATCPDQKLRNGREAVILASRAATATGRNNPEFLDTLAAAYAEQSDFEKAIQTATEAVGLAQNLGRQELMLQISSRIEELYKKGQPYRETPE